MAWDGLEWVKGEMEGREVAMMQIVQEERVEEHEQKDEIRREGIKKKRREETKTFMLASTAMQDMKSNYILVTPKQT